MYHPLEEPATSIILHDITPLKAIIFNITNVKTSNLTELNHRLKTNSEGRKEMLTSYTHQTKIRGNSCFSF
jgi:predicted transcriptional regulator YheO